MPTRLEALETRSPYRLALGDLEQLGLRDCPARAPPFPATAFAVPMLRRLVLCALLLFGDSCDHISSLGIRDWSSCGGLHRRLLLGLVITQDLHSSNQLVLL